MNNFDQIILNSLNYNIESTMTELRKRTKCGNRNTLVNAVDRLEKEGIVTSRKDGRERLVKIPMPLEETKKFVNNYGITLKKYSEIINENLKLFKKNMPIVPKKGFPMKKIKTREPVLELDKEKKMWTFQGKTQEGYAYTWKTRAKPLRYFNTILNILKRVYEESSAISFSEYLDDESNNKEYQKKSKTLITDTIDKLVEILDKDPESKAYGIFYIRNTLHGLIHQIILDNQRKSNL